MDSFNNCLSNDNSNISQSPKLLNFYLKKLTEQKHQIGELERQRDLLTKDKLQKDTTVSELQEMVITLTQQNILLRAKVSKFRDAKSLSSGLDLTTELIQFQLQAMQKSPAEPTPVRSNLLEEIDDLREILQHRKREHRTEHGLIQKLGQECSYFASDPQIKPPLEKSATGKRKMLIGSKALAKQGIARNKAFSAKYLPSHLRLNSRKGSSK